MWPGGTIIEELNAESAAFCPCELLVYNQNNSKIFKLFDLNTISHFEDYLDLSSHILPSTPIDSFLCTGQIIINPFDTALIYLWNNSSTKNSHFLKIDLKPGIIQSTAINNFTNSLFYSKHYDPKQPALYELDLETLTTKKDCSTGGKINAIAVNQENKTVATASDDTTMRLWDSNSGKAIMIIPHTTKVRSVDLHGHHAATGTCAPQGDVYLWDIRTTKKPLKVFQLSSSNSSPFMRARYGSNAKPSVSFLSFKPDGTSLVMQNESYDGPQSQIFERFIGQISVNLHNLKLITTSYARKKKHDENNNN
jgi:WD40 repeat protein